MAAGEWTSRRSMLAAYRRAARVATGTETGQVVTKRQPDSIATLAGVSKPRTIPERPSRALHSEGRRGKQLLLVPCSPLGGADRDAHFRR